MQKKKLLTTAFLFGFFLLGFFALQHSVNASIIVSGGGGSCVPTRVECQSISSTGAPVHCGGDLVCSTAFGIPTCLAPNQGEENSFCAAQNSGGNTSCYDYSGQYQISSNNAYCSDSNGTYSSYTPYCNLSVAPVQIGCWPVSISGTTVYDSTSGSNIGSGYYGDAFTASVWTSNADSVSFVITEDGQHGEHWGDSGSGSSTGYKGYTLNPVGGVAQPGEVFTFKVTFTAQGIGGPVSSSTTFTMTYPTTYGFNCKTPVGSGSLIASDISLSSDQGIVLFDNDPAARCSTGTFQRTAITLPSSDPNFSAFSTDKKDSILYFPTGNVTDNQCRTKGDESDRTVITTGLFSGRVWIVHWCYQKTANIYNTVDPTTVKAAVLVNGLATPTADMEIDNLNGGNPSYLWVSSQANMTYRIDWNTVNNFYKTWLGNNFTNPPGAINGSNYKFVSPGTLTNGIKVLNGQFFVSSVNNSIRNISSYNPYSGSLNGRNNPFSSSISGGYSTPGDTWLQCDNCDGGQDYWHIDGLTASKDGKYIFASTGGGKMILVFNGNGSPIGLAPITGIPDSAPNGGIDGIEIDNNYQLYLADETNGIYSVDASPTDGQSVITAAQKNGMNLRAYYRVQAQQYVAPNGNNWDDIAPLSGTGSNNGQYSPYYTTKNGNVFSDNNYSISTLNKQFDPSAAQFSTYAVISGQGGNSFNDGIASLYNWEFDKYSSGITHNPGGSRSSNPADGYASLYNQICTNNNNVCVQVCNNNNSCPAHINNGTIDNTTSTLTGSTQNGKNIVYTYDASQSGGALTINGDNGGTHSGINANGVVLVKGDVNITANPLGKFNNMAGGSPAPSGAINPANTPISGVVGRWWNNQSELSPQVATTSDGIINYATPGATTCSGLNIATPSPFPSGVNPTSISAEWNGFLTVPTSGAYSIGLCSDDGSMLKIDDVTLNNDLAANHPPILYPGNMTLASGRYYPFDIKWHNGTSQGVASFVWKLPGASTYTLVPAANIFNMPTTSGLIGNWYNGTTMSGSVTANSNSSVINFATDGGYDTANGSGKYNGYGNPPFYFGNTRCGITQPFPYSIPPNVTSSESVSAQWQGYIYAPTTGTYTIGVCSDDGTNLTVNGQTITNELSVGHATQLKTASINLTAGTYYPFDLKWENQNVMGAISLVWQKPGASSITLIDANSLASTALPPTSGKFMTIANGNTTISPSSYYKATNDASVNYQTINMGILTDKNFTIKGYNPLPNYIEPMVINGIVADYGQGNANGTKSTNLNYDMGYLDQWYPAAQINYDAGYINQFSALFSSLQSTQEYGL